MKATEKIIGRLIVGCVLACCLISNSSAQPQPSLSISNASPASVQVNWTNQVGITYRVWFTTNLATPFSSWPPLEDAFSADSTVSIYASTTDTPVGFFRIQIPTNSSTANVQIFSPSDTQTVSGEIGVRMGAQLGTQVQGVNLYLDDALVGYLNSGGMNFDLDTTHFANGQHTVYVGAVDTANNETLSSSITLDFENSVRWLDASSMFNYFVPIDVTSDFFPADWLVTVTDTNGTIVRTITGSTTDGNIQTSWDGTDDLNQPLPVENLYQIIVDVTETSGSTMMMASSLASTLGATSVSSKLNLHGVPEYTVQKPAPNPLTAYLETLKIYQKLTSKEKLIYPPLLPRPANNPNATTTVMISARDMFLARHQTSSTTLSLAAGTAAPNAGSDMRHGATKSLVWQENVWSSGKILISRVPIPGALGTTVANNCNSIATMISDAVAGGAVGANRDLFGPYVQVVSTSSDVVGMTNHLADPSITAFYFYGHGSPSGNAIGTQSAVVKAIDLSYLLGNFYWSSLPPTWGTFAGRKAMLNYKPFNFVFLDGCNTALGDLPEAFGIPKNVSGLSLNEAGLHKRAFLGWTGTVTFQLDSSHIDWSVQFWTAWMDSGNADVSLTDALREAYRHDPSVFNNVPIKWYGNGSLKWSDP